MKLGFAPRPAGTLRRESDAVRRDPTAAPPRW